MEDLYQMLLLIGVGFLAGVINTLAGGGSIFTLPVLLFLGLPPAIANGTNRIPIVVQSLSGALGYKSKGVSTFPFNIYLGISASIGAFLGAQIALDISGLLFNRILAIIMLVFGLLILIQSKKFSVDLPERLTGKYLLYSILGFFLIGIYGGFINAGIGIVIMIFLNRVNHLSLVKTNATKVVVVFIYSTIALALFTYYDAVDWKLGGGMAVGTSLGAWFSSRWSVKKGDHVIRLAMLITILIMALKLWFF
ncbi:MAG: sulfite exporter TauE/SafE family protein [Flavobacteriaceae bacterium]